MLVQPPFATKYNVLDRGALFLTVEVAGSFFHSLSPLVCCFSSLQNRFPRPASFKVPCPKPKTVATLLCAAALGLFSVGRLLFFCQLRLPTHSLRLQLATNSRSRGDRDPLGRDRDPCFHRPETSYKFGVNQPKFYYFFLYLK